MYLSCAGQTTFSSDSDGFGLAVGLFAGGIPFCPSRGSRITMLGEGKEGGRIAKSRVWEGRSAR